MIFNVWVEGYVATGERAGATFLGAVEAETFPEACRKATEAKGWGMSSYKDDPPRFWGCRYYDNETDARATFG